MARRNEEGATPIVRLEAHLPESMEPLLKARIEALGIRGAGISTYVRTLVMRDLGVEPSPEPRCRGAAIAPALDATRSVHGHAERLLRVYDPLAADSVDWTKCDALDQIRVMRATLGVLVSQLPMKAREAAQ